MKGKSKRIPQPGDSYSNGHLTWRYRPKRERWRAWHGLGRFFGAAGLLVLAALLFVQPTASQLQQSGGGGANSSVGATGAAVPTSATYAGGNVTTAAPAYTTATMNALSLNTSGGLRVDGSAVTQPVSGTVSITANSSVNVNQIAGTAASVNNGAADAGTVRVSLANNSTGTVRPLTSCAGTIFDSAITTVPTVEAAATAATTCVQNIYCNNLTAAAQTFSIKDNAATPIVIVNAFSLPANSNILLQFGGIKFNLGVRWVATNASAVNCQILGYQ